MATGNLLFLETSALAQECNTKKFSKLCIVQLSHLFKKARKNKKNEVMLKNFNTELDGCIKIISLHNLKCKNGDTRLGYNKEYKIAI